VLCGDADIDVLRTMGKNLDIGITSCKHNGVATGSDLDAEVKARLEATPM